MEYRVILNDKLKTVTEYCDCGHCKGHSHQEEINFDELIEADSPEEAKAKAIDLMWETYEVGKSTLAKAPIVILSPGEKVLSRKAELDLLERWNKGLGLPSFQIQYEYTYDA